MNNRLYEDLTLNEVENWGWDKSVRSVILDLVGHIRELEQALRKIDAVAYVSLGDTPQSLRAIGVIATIVRKAQGRVE